MSKIDHRAIFLLLVGFLLAAAFSYPDALGDSNSFMKEFVGSDLLSVLGFITAVTVASAGTVHLHLNNLADHTTKRFPGVRRALLKSTVSMVSIFALALLIVVFKQVLPKEGVTTAITNVVAISAILFDLSIMLDITRTVFKIPPKKDIE